MLDFIVTRIKNPMLSVIAWDVLNENLNLRTILVAKRLQWEYMKRNIRYPDLVDAVAAYNRGILENMIYDGSLLTLLRDLIEEAENFESGRVRTLK